MDLFAKEITWVTCVGVITDSYPVPHGNCFSVIGSDGKHYKIVNFAHENIVEAVRRGVEFPIRIKSLSDRIAIVHDERIPDDWYDYGFCEVCCPKDLLPVTQLVRHERQIARGERMEQGDIVCLDFSKRPELQPVQE